MGDIPDWCCAAGVCCDMVKRIKALTRILAERIGFSHEYSHEQAHRSAVLLSDNLDMLPKAAGLDAVVDFIRDHPDGIEAEALKTAMQPVIAYLQAHPYK